MADEPAGGTFINLAVPPGAEAGVDSLSFEYGGASLEFLIPPGSVAGDVLRIQVGAAADGDGDGDGGDDGEEGGPQPSSGFLDELGGVDDVSPAAENDGTKTGGLLSELGGMQDKDKRNSSSHKVHAACSADGVTTVELGDGMMQANDGGQGGVKVTKLQLLESKTTSAEGKSAEGDGTHGMVWASGTLLAQALTSSIGVQFLSRLIQEHTAHGSAEDKKPTLRCLELGAGLGVCGLALAHALASCSDKDFSASVLMTDQGEEAVDLLEKNIKRNRPTEGRIAVGAEPLLWGSSLSPQSGAEGRFHLILGSDLLYNTQASYDPLVSTIKQCLHTSGTALLAVRWRKPDLEREFFRKAEAAGLEFQLWKELGDDEHFGKLSPCTLGWKEYGDPECDASNRFFHETKTSGKSLAEMMERGVESMNDEEYASFEEAQCQIYIGKWSKVDEKRPSKRQRAESP